MDFVTSVALALLVLVLSRAALGIAHSHKFFPEKIIVRHYEKLRRRVAKLLAKSRVEAPPAISNAPGLAWKRLKKGWRAEWRAPRDVIRQGFSPAKISLWFGEKDALSPVAKCFVVERAQHLQQEMLAHSGPSMDEILSSIRRIISEDEAKSASK